MAFTNSDIRETPPAPMVATIKSPSIANVSATIAADSYLIVKQGSAEAGTEPDSNNWQVGLRPVLSYCLVALGNGASLNISLSPNGTNFYFWSTLLLMPLTPNVDKLYLPALLARFEIYNANASASVDVLGHLKVEGA